MNTTDHEQCIRLIVGWINQQLRADSQPEDHLLLRIAEQVIADIGDHDFGDTSNWDLPRLICDATEQVKTKTPGEQQQLGLVIVSFPPKSPAIGGPYMDHGYVAEPGVPFCQIGNRLYCTDGSVAPSRGRLEI